MRQHYQLLHDALTALDNVAFHLFGGIAPTEAAQKESLFILQESRRLIREELKHPERFNLDGTKRVMKVRLPQNRKTGDIVVTTTKGQPITITEGGI